ncbi:hypothetical protein LXA43DRAFT_1101235 [Ganoderma leucocontextum]|nr:hypothetical protein LXA43DRAFT_1101235 [Ganoderma leucocontextum]
MPPLPKVDNRLIHIFLSVVLIRDFLPHTRTCNIGAKHQPKVDAGQDPNNVHRLFMVYEECVGVNGQRCCNHGLQFFMQLTEKQLVHAVAQVVQLEPFPYHSEALLDWCVNYLLPRHDLLPGHLIPPARAPPPQPTSTASTRVAPPPRGLTRPSTPRDRRYRGWVTNLIPALSAGGNNPGPLRHPSSTRPSASVSVAAPATTLAKVYAYTKDGHQQLRQNVAMEWRSTAMEFCWIAMQSEPIATPLPRFGAPADGRHPVVIEVDANHQGTMTYVNLRHPDILQVFGLKARARNIPDKIQVYDTYGGKWYHPATVALWLHLNPHEFLILKAPTITSTLGLEDYAKANLAKPARGGVDTLRGFLALSRTPDDRRLPFSPVPPLTVMFADVPAPDTLVTVSKAAKKPQATQKTKATQHTQVIVISDDERPTIVRTSNAREVIIISDEDEPVIRGSVAQSTGAGGSNIAPARADPTAPRNELVSRRFPSLTPCTSFRVTRTRAKGKGKMRAVEDEDDSGADSDKTLC